MDVMETMRESQENQRFIRELAEILGVSCGAVVTPEVARAVRVKAVALKTKNAELREKIECLKRSS